MKITDVKATAMRPILVQIYTDEGVMGIGECSPMNAKIVAHFVNTALKPILMGKNPLEINKLWNRMTFGTYKLGVQVMFHSFHNGHADGPNIHTVIMRPTLQARAATNHIWACATNTAASFATWPGVVISSDGVIKGSLRMNRAGLMVNTVDTTKKYYNAGAPWRDRAIRGVLHSGTVPRDPRLRKRKTL